MPVAENITLASLKRFSPMGWLRNSQENQCAREHIESLGIRCTGPRQPVRFLSGGNQQKVLLARCLETKPKLLLLDEPTASVEPESESLIHDSILKRTRVGAGTTMLVTHRIDLLRQAPRILFLEEGELTGDGTHGKLVACCPGYEQAYHRWEVEEAVVVER